MKFKRTEMKFKRGDLCATITVWHAFKRREDTSTIKDAEGNFVAQIIETETIAEVIDYAPSSNEVFAWFPTLNCFGYISETLLKACND